MSAHADLLSLAARAAAGNNLPHTNALSQLRGVDPKTARRAAVLMLFGALDTVPARSAKPYAPADLDVLLIERASSLLNHPGQIAFPGGGIDAGDASAEAAALREAVEETGLDPAGVEILGSLPQVGLPVSNFLVTPVLAWWAAPSPVEVVDFGESAQVFRVPVRDLLDPANRVTAVLKHPDRVHRSPAFTVNGVVIWGFTGILLSGLFDQLEWTVPWDASREQTPPL